MIVFLCLIWFIIYIWSVCSSFLRLRKLNGAITVLAEYLNSATMERPSYDCIGYRLIKRENYQRCLSDALCKFPVISKYVGYYCGTLKYGASDFENYTTAVQLYNELAMKRNYLFEALKSSFNPLCSLKTLFALPVSFLSWLGVPLKIPLSKLVNLLC